MSGRRAGVALTVGVVLLTSCAEAGSGGARPAPGAWTELPAAPVSPRTGAVAAWTGAEALFLGGDIGDLCPPDAGCSAPATSARDGAAFDPATRSWRRTADAPRQIPGSTPVTVSGDTAHLLLEDRLLSYDASEDAWSVSPAIPGPGSGWGGLAATDDGDVVVVAGEWQEGAPPDQVYDPGSRTWSGLPADPLGPSFGRGVTAVPGALVLTGREWTANPGAEEPSLLRAAVLDPDSGQWRLLPESDQLGGGGWAWTGSRLVDPMPGVEDGGETNGWGRTVPYAGALDPSTGEWAPLPDAPEPGTGAWPVHALGGRLSAVGGWVYDDADSSWTVLPRPQGAPAEPGAAVWAGNRLVVMGGLDSDAGWTDEHLTGRAWMWTHGAAHDADGGVTGDALAGSWVLVEGTSGGEPIDIPAGGRATLVVEETSLGGTAFCNSYGGEYDLDGSTLLLRGVGGTEMACETRLMAAEDAYLTVLRGGRLDVSLQDGELLLRAGEGTLRFRSLAPVADGDLAGTRWVLEGLVTGTTVSSPAGDPAVLQLRDDGTVAGSTGCREFTGTWETFGDEVRFPDFGFDADAECPAAPAAQDGHVVGVLEGGFSVSIDGDVLTASGSDGTGLVYRAR